jgi:mRNA (guanine-N7-)-methyltransferase
MFLTACALTFSSGDLRKYKIGNISRLVCTDIASTSVDQCRDRYSQMKRGRIFDCDFIVADSTRDRLRDRFTDPIKFDMVSVQFVLHYSFESLAQAERMLRNISENMKIGGFWIGTTTDADQLVVRARRAKSRTFGNEVSI